MKRTPVRNLLVVLVIVLFADGWSEHPERGEHA
jgi:hypothetical protein